MPEEANKRVGFWNAYYLNFGWAWLEDISPYVEAYFGMDPYNVQFTQYRSMLRFGVATLKSHSGTLIDTSRR